MRSDINISNILLENEEHNSTFIYISSLVNETVGSKQLQIQLLEKQRKREKKYKDLPVDLGQ